RHLHSFPTRRSSDLRKRNDKFILVACPMASGCPKLRSLRQKTPGTSRAHLLLQTRMPLIVNSKTARVQPEMNHNTGGISEEYYGDRKSTRLNSSHVS